MRLEYQLCLTLSYSLRCYHTIVLVHNTGDDGRRSPRAHRYRLHDLNYLRTKPAPSRAYLAIETPLAVCIKRLGTFTCMVQWPSSSTPSIPLRTVYPKVHIYLLPGTNLLLAGTTSASLTHFIILSAYPPFLTAQRPRRHPTVPVWRSIPLEYSGRCYMSSSSAVLAPQQKNTTA